MLRDRFYLMNKRRLLKANTVLKIVVESAWSQIGRCDQRSTSVSYVDLGMKPRRPIHDGFRKPYAGLGADSNIVG